jgi:hypothetical protein
MEFLFVSILVIDGIIGNIIRIEMAYHTLFLILHNTSHRLVVYIKQPSLIEATADLLLAPFSVGLWLGVVTAISILMFSLTATWHLGGRCSEDTEDIFSFGVSWFCIIGSFCQQGT